MKQFFLFVFGIISLSSVHAQSAWTPKNEADIAINQYGERSVTPSNYNVYSLDIKMLTKDLKKSTIDTWKDTETQEIQLPLPNGEMHTFKVWNSPVMHPELAAKYPSINTYRIVSTTIPYINGRVDMSDKGFHASIRHTSGQYYIDPYAEFTKDVYISYFKKDDNTPSAFMTSACGAEFSAAEIADALGIDTNLSRAAGEVPLKKYRFALACTGEFGRNYNSKDEVIEDMALATNRINELLGNEASIFFELIANNDEVVFLDPETDPYIITPNAEDGVHPGRQVLGQNSSILNSIIKLPNYDIGHVLTRSCTDGIAGVANASSVCTDNKGAGVSCVGNANLINFMVDVTLHEIGHQFGASHTWSNCSDQSADQLSSGTAYEPGSGTTFMSYAGVCAGQNNVQGSGDPYYHVGSLVQVYNFYMLGAGSTCGETMDIDNTCPTVALAYNNGFSIPIFTPFELTGSAFDAEGDPLTYTWEQFNTGPISPYGQPIGNAPAFRSYPPSENSTRYFPRLDKILANSYDNSERLQDVGRDYDFYFTARDNHPGGGIAAWTNVKFESSSNAGPFFVQQPNNNEQLVVGKPYTIKWEVANTDQAPVNCQFVDILLSTNGGTVMDRVLALSTPNDGEETIIVPNAITEKGRVKIKASENIFFDISNFNFDIVAPSEPAFFFEVSENIIDVCIPETVTIDLSTAAFSGFSNMVNFEIVTDLPSETIVTLNDTSLTPDNGATQLILDFSNVNATGTFFVDIIGSADGSDTLTQTISVTLTSENFDDHFAIAPANSTGGIPELPTFEWNDTPNAKTFTIEVGRNPALGNTAEFRVEGLTSSTFTPPASLEKNSLYYWRVYATNKCASAVTPLQLFATEALSCSFKIADDVPLLISASGTPTVESKIFVSGGGTVTDVNVKKIKGNHDNVKNLTMSLISPSLTEVILVEKRCNSTTSFDCGFDDSAAGEIACPLTNGTIYKPENPLNVFNGEPIVGDWILRVKDNNAGDGGQVNEIEIEICSNEVLEGPQLVTNEVLEVLTASTLTIDADAHLLTTDGNNTAADLMYTIVEVPQFGDLKISGTTAVVGSTFTQKDIDDMKVKYTHTNPSELADNFFFTVVDGEGGWIPLTEFVINMGSGFASATEDELQYFSVNLYPNPASNMVAIQVNTESKGDYQIDIFDMTGKQLYTRQVTVVDNLLHYVDASQFVNGMVVVKIQNNKNQIIKLLGIQK